MSFQSLRKAFNIVPLWLFHQHKHFCFPDRTVSSCKQFWRFFQPHRAYLGRCGREELWAPCCTCEVHAGSCLFHCLVESSWSVVTPRRRWTQYQQRKISHSTSQVLRVYHFLGTQKNELSIPLRVLQSFYPQCPYSPKPCHLEVTNTCTKACCSSQKWGRGASRPDYESGAETMSCIQLNCSHVHWFQYVSFKQ